MQSHSKSRLDLPLPAVPNLQRSVPSGFKMPPPPPQRPGDLLQGKAPPPPAPKEKAVLSRGILSLGLTPGQEESSPEDSESSVEEDAIAVPPHASPDDMQLPVITAKTP